MKRLFICQHISVNTETTECMERLQTPGSKLQRNFKLQLQGSQTAIINLVLGVSLDLGAWSLVF